MSMSLCIYESLFLCIYVSMYLCIHVSAYPPIRLSTYLGIYVSMCLCIHVSVYPCIHVSMYFFSSRTFFPQKVSSGWLFYWAVSRQCHFYTGGSGCAWRAGPNPSLSSLGAGWETAGRWGGKGHFWQKLADGGGVPIRSAGAGAV